MWKELLALACDDDEKAMYILEVLFAQLLQNPGINSHAGWSTSSHKKGAGKDSFLEVIKAIIGPQYYFETASPSQELFGDHSVGLLRKLLVHVNESEELRHNAAKVRHMVTAKQLSVNEKFLRQYNIKNLARWAVSGNDEGLVKADRRFFVTQFSGARVGDAEFWSKVHSWKADKRNLKAVHDHLLSIDLSQVGDMQALFATHATSATQRAALTNADPITHFVVSQVESQFQHVGQMCKDEDTQKSAGWPTEVISTEDLYRQYAYWGVHNNLWSKDELPKPDKITFGQQLSYRFCGSKGQANDAPMKKMLVGKARLAGFKIHWQELKKELVRAHYMAEEEEETEIYDDGVHSDDEF